jgi:hypothetical protein
MSVGDFAGIIQMSTGASSAFSESNSLPSEVATADGPPNADESSAATINPNPAQDLDFFTFPLAGAPTVAPLGPATVSRSGMQPRLPAGA